MRLRNGSSSELTHVEATLTTSESSVGIRDDYAYVASIPAGSAVWTTDAFDVDLNFTGTRNCSFGLHVSYHKNGSQYYETFSINKTFYADGVSGPVFEVDHVVWDDSEHGDGDGILESGEEANFYVYLRNSGTADASDVEAMVLDVPQFDVPETWNDYPDLSAGGSAYPPVRRRPQQDLPNALGPGRYCLN